MYLSRLSFHTLPGKTHEVEERLKELARMVGQRGGDSPRVLRSHLSSPGSPDVLFEQTASSLAVLEEQIQQVTASNEFRQWSQGMSGLLREPPKREVYLVVDAA